jgi:D-alanine-D-alanine ligase
MKIGLSYDLKSSVPLGHSHPDDALEEYDSPETVEGIAAAIEAQGYSAVKLGGGREFLSKVVQADVDLVFNIAEGLGNYRSREAQVPSVLEMLDIPYSGSDPQCLAISLDKPLTKKILRVSGIQTPKWLVLNSVEELKQASWNDFPFPVFIKPANEGSSVGITSGSVAGDSEQAITIAAEMVGKHRRPVIVEEFLSGDDITVGVVGNSPPVIVGIMRVLPKHGTGPFIYSLEMKRDWERLVEYQCPALLDSNILKKINEASLRIFNILGCRDFSRIDFKLDSKGEPYFLEINPLPGLNPKSGDLPIMAKKMGWTYQGLISAILKAAMERYPQCCQK